MMERRFGLWAQKKSFKPRQTKKSKMHHNACSCCASSHEKILTNVILRHNFDLVNRESCIHQTSRIHHSFYVSNSCVFMLVFSFYFYFCVNFFNFFCKCPFFSEKLTNKMKTDGRIYLILQKSDKKNYSISHVQYIAIRYCFVLITWIYFKKIVSKWNEDGAEWKAVEKNRNIECYSLILLLYYLIKLGKTFLF